MDAAVVTQPATIESDEIAELYRRDAAQLLRVVGRGVRAPEPVIEDACQAAWGRLLDRRDRVRRDAVASWLVVTAVHEACRLVRRAGREVSLDQLLDEFDPFPWVAAGPAPDETLDHRARLHALRSLPERQRRLVWLQGIGLSYAEMALQTGATVRTVERQLLRARRRLAEAATDDA
ncbi:MAG: RNA polymerase sigma factor [Solirubrobacteraceae bacterium]